MDCDSTTEMLPLIFLEGVPVCIERRMGRNDIRQVSPALPIGKYHGLEVSV